MGYILYISFAIGQNGWNPVINICLMIVNEGTNKRLDCHITYYHLKKRHVVNGTPTHNSCRTLNCKGQRGTALAIVNLRYKVDKFHVAVVSPAVLSFKTGTQ